MGADLMKTLGPDYSTTTKLHIMTIADGSFKTIDTGKYQMMMHVGNAFVKDGKFITDAMVYQDTKKDVFELFEFEHLSKGLKGQDYKSAWRRFEIDLTSGDLVQEDLDILKWGNYDLPTYNPKYDGVGENCFTYLMEFMSKQDVDDAYSWDMVKFDSCKREVASRWSHPGHLPNEAFFIENP